MYVRTRKPRDCCSAIRHINRFVLFLLSCIFIVLIRISNFVSELIITNTLTVSAWKEKALKHATTRSRTMANNAHSTATELANWRRRRRCLEVNAIFTAFLRAFSAKYTDFFALLQCNGYLSCSGQPLRSFAPMFLWLPYSLFPYNTIRGINKLGGETKRAMRRKLNGEGTNSPVK